MQQFHSSSIYVPKSIKVIRKEYISLLNWNIIKQGNGWINKTMLLLIWNENFRNHCLAYSFQGFVIKWIEWTDSNARPIILNSTKKLRHIFLAFFRQKIPFKIVGSVEKSFILYNSEDYLWSFCIHFLNDCVLNILPRFQCSDQYDKELAIAHRTQRPPRSQRGIPSEYLKWSKF